LSSAKREGVLVEMSCAQPVALWSHFFCHNAASISARMLEFYNEQYCQRSTIGASTMGNDRSRHLRNAWIVRDHGARASRLL
jgi:hypothetical protein